MQFPQYESGLQFLGRLIKRPSLQAVCTNLFPDGIGPKEVVEVEGDSNCGKTCLITEIMAKCILPNHFDGIKIGGLDVSVVFINNDYHFKMFKLVSLMKSYIQKCCDTETLGSLFIEKLLKYSLSKITILNCTDSYQFKITMQVLSQLVLDDSTIGLVVVDSISANYCQDRLCGGLKRYDDYTEAMLKSLQAITDLNVPIIYAKPSYFKSRPKRFRDSELKTNQGATCKIYLSGLKVIETGEAYYKCYVVTSSFKSKLFYKIESDQICWLPIDS